MKFKELIEKHTTGLRDTKARRVLNTSNKTANITASEIENGIEIETLEKLNVPFYLYGGQITIHGNLPDFQKNTVNGYQSIFKNKNGSIGIKYTAIDGTKKSIISKALCYCKKGNFSYQSDSQETLLVKSVKTREDAIKELSNFPECYVGSKYGIIGMYGGIYVVIDIRAVYHRDLFKLIGYITDREIDSKDKYEKVKREYREKRKKEAEQFRIESEKRDERIKKNRAAFIKKVKAEGELVSKITEEGHYAIIKSDIPRRINVRKYGNTLKYQTSFREHQSYLKTKTLRGPNWSSFIKNADIYKVKP